MLLIFLILVPFITGIIAWQAERIRVCIPQWIALVGISIVFFFSFLLWLNSINCCSSVLHKLLQINSSSIWIIEYIFTWIPRFGINLHFALDGLSLLMLMLSSFLGFIAILNSWNSIYRYQGLFYFNLLWILGGSIGVCLSIDMFFFFFFWEITLIPIYFLISIWGYEELYNNNRICAANKFFIYSQLSGLCMLMSILALVYFNYSIKGFWSFDYEDLLCTVLPKDIEYLLMLGFFLAFVIKMPVIPFHAWLPEVHSYAPVVCSVELIGVLLKISIYGFFRFTLPLFPNVMQDFAIIAMSLGIFNIIYGAWMAFVQIDMKRFIAYASISHMGLSLVAIYSNSQLSYQGVIIQMVTYSLSVSGLLILCGQLWERLHTRNMTIMGGLWNNINLIPAFSLFFIVAMLGIPGTGNFVGEMMILIGTFQKAPIVAVIATLGILFTSVYSLIFMQRVYYGTNSILSKPLLNMTCREKFVILILLLSVILIGLFPQFILNTSYETVQNLCIKLQKSN